MSEILNSTENTEENKSLDDNLYEQFSENASFQAYEYLAGDKDYRKEQERQFVSGEIQNPTLDYPSINQENIKKVEDALIQMKRSLIDNEQNEVVKQAYRWRLNEKIAEIRLLKATAENDMHRFKRYSEFIYGKPSEDIFAYTINSVRDEAEESKNSNNQDISQAAINLLNILPEMDRSRIADLPDEDVVNYAHQKTLEDLSNLINIPAESPIEATQIEEAFNYALTELGNNEWKVIIDTKSSKTAVSVDQEHMVVNIPQSRNVSVNKLSGLIVHEIGTHVARRTNGERSKLKLLGLGLDRYESGEEGIATMREQAISNKMEDFSGLDSLLAIGLSLGLDGSPRDFRQVYEILEKYYLFTNVSKGKDLLESSDKAKESAWNRSIRTFRGTDCKTPGVCFTKDIVYREGSIGIWDVIKNNPEEMIRFNIGKYDPANERHLWILSQLGITDQDLSSLEQN